MKRRGALRWIISGCAGLALPHPAFAGSSETSEDWLDAVASKRHSAFLDIRSFSTDGAPFRKAINLHETLVDGHGVLPADIGIAFGAGSDAIAHLFTASVWRDLPIGSKLSEAGTSAKHVASLKNDPGKWAQAGEAGVRDLRQKGIRVLACRKALARWSRDLAQTTGTRTEDVSSALFAGLLPGVEPVPAMIAAAVLAQGRSVPYVAIG